MIDDWANEELDVIYMGIDKHGKDFYYISCKGQGCLVFPMGHTNLVMSPKATFAVESYDKLIEVLEVK